MSAESHHTDEFDPLAVHSDLGELLAGWLPHQRWFAGRGALHAGVGITSRAVVADRGDARYEHLLIEVPGVAGAVARTYQLWLAFHAELPDRLEHSRIGVLSGSATDSATDTDSSGSADGADGSADSAHSEVVADALRDPRMTSLLLESMATGTDLGPVHGRAAAGSVIDVSAPGRVITGEQSNTSIVYGDTSILKIFRRIEPGPNPDAEVHLALAEAGSANVARLFGDLSGDVEGEPTTLGVLTQFFSNSADGWLTATASVRDLMGEADLRADEVGGDFAAEARRLGVAVAQVHHDLAAAFGTTTVRHDELQVTIGEMVASADRIIVAVPDLQPHADAIRRTFADAGDSAASLTLQRIHGDLHLGQTLRTLTGWAIIDFEGEPSRPLAYRRAQHSPLRDVAGMLRSFDYAAHHLLAGTQSDAQHLFRANEWATRNRRFFCDGYAETAGSDPRQAGTLLRAFELDKALYEVGYEHDHRPSWVPIPLHAVAQLIR